METINHENENMPFIVNTTKVWLLFLSICAAVALLPKLGRGTNPTAVLKLDYCVLPCWIGIIPGKTTIAEARHLIQASYPEFRMTVTNADYIYSFAYALKLTAKHNEFYLFVIFNDSTNEAPNDSSVIHDIAVLIDSQNENIAEVRPTVIDMMLALGRPDCLVPLYGNHTSWPAMLYPRLHILISVGLPDLKVDPYGSSVLHIADAQETCRTNNAVWRGFGHNHFPELIASMLP
jgi:hypothetical protein